MSSVPPLESPPKAICFDLDGTLLDSLVDLADSMNAALREFGHPEYPTRAYRYFVGNGARALVTRTLPEVHRDPETIEVVFQCYQAIYRANWNNKTRPYPGIPELLDALQARDLPLTVLSNKPHASTIVCVEEILKDWEFDVVLGQRDSVPHKPDPAGVFEIAEKLQLVPSDFLYLGDSVIDMQTATVAGCVIVGVLWGFREGDELRQHGAQYLIETPLDLLKLLPSVRV
ncbi:MAG: HAD family hydrolase [SAR324 cluster bacterium]|nr:HAD family hydrolase [SAR324 cluster bacterium]